MPLPALLNDAEVMVAQELTLGVRGTTEKKFGLKPRSLTVDFSPEIEMGVKIHPYRTPTETEIVGRLGSLSMTGDFEPKTGGLLQLMAMGRWLQRSTGVIDAYTVPPGTPLPSLAMEIGFGVEDLWGPGEQTLEISGIVITRLLILVEAEGQNLKYQYQLDAIPLKPKITNIATVSVLDHANLLLSGNVMTFVIEGESNVTVTEGVDYTPATSNANTASLINTAIMGKPNLISQVSGDSVIVKAINGKKLTVAAHDGDTDHLTITNTSDVIRGNAPLIYTDTTLFHGRSGIPFHKGDGIFSYNGGGYQAGLKYRAWQIEIQNSVFPEKHASGDSDLYPDDLILTSQNIVGSVSQNFFDNILFHAAWKNESKTLQHKITHPLPYNGGADQYQFIFDFGKVHFTNDSPLVDVRGGDSGVNTRAYGFRAYTPERVEGVVGAFTGTDHTLALGTNNREGYSFSTNQAGIATGIEVQLATDANGTDRDVKIELYTDDGGAPSVPDVPTVETNEYSLLPLNETYRTIRLWFTKPLKVDASTKFWKVIQSESGSGVVLANGSAAGTDTHTQSADGGGTWGATDTDRIWFKLIFDDVPIRLEVRSDETYPLPS